MVCRPPASCALLLELQEVEEHAVLGAFLAALVSRRSQEAVV
jgi:hypothetical protein